ncbi:peptidyl-prolyl cis-trans isomerase CYP59-like [Hordeum vulgare subsp. vulgare]|uniref:peptidyl-prolyl cis-trans isomerase CYP59-like n=1 Tax=Hordeum vulgare subsp. vulgare TaxID=112509 RepID=UPI001D1A32BA|nr:peptidyl-prolyl cis-trans isomerase CYP59-like [Hordeum vulgare subsp. vulgare]
MSVAIVLLRYLRLEGAGGEPLDSPELAGKGRADHLVRTTNGAREDYLWRICRMKYYNGCLFHKVEKDFLEQSGDPTGTGSGGDSVYKFLYGDQARFFNDEIRPELRHSKTVTIAMASAGENCNASQFYITLRDDVDYLDDKHTVFGTVAEGLDTLTKINEAYADDKGRPFKDIRIKHTYILDDPFDDPPQLAELIPENSPLGKPRDEVKERLEDSWVPLDETVDPGQLEELIRSKEAHANAVILESVCSTIHLASLIVKALLDYTHIPSLFDTFFTDVSLHGLSADRKKVVQTK